MRPILCSCRTILFVHARNRGGCRRTDCREVYPLGASPHSSFNLNRIRLACLVGCLEEYDNRLRAQITFLLQIKMYLMMTMTPLSSKRRKYDRGRSSSFGKTMILFLATMLLFTLWSKASFLYETYSMFLSHDSFRTRQKQGRVSTDGL